MSKLFLLSLFISPALFAQDFYGYECTQDCSGHEAGYEWAMENEINDPGDCGGNSNSFIEGCLTFANEPHDDYVDYSDYYDEH